MINYLEFAEEIKNKSLKLGANAADVLIRKSSSLSTEVRLGKLESVTRSDFIEVGLRTFIDKKNALVSTNDLNSDSIENLVSHAIALTKASPEDKFTGIADLVSKPLSFKNYQEEEPTEHYMQEQALIAEEAMMRQENIKNSDGAGFSSSKAEVFYVASNGFAGSYKNSGASIYASGIAEKNGLKETDYEYDTCVFYQDLMDAKTLGENAGKRASNKLDSKKLSSRKYPVIIENRVASQILISLAAAINGSNIARKTSFMLDSLDKQVFANNINIIDDPFMEKGLRSCPFDTEGMTGERRKFIDNGVLTSWILDLKSARELNLKTTAHSRRSASSHSWPAPTNFYLEPGEKDVASLLKEFEECIYVTDIFGHGADIITGEFSAGIAGFFVKNGVIIHAISQMTIASHMNEIFKNIVPANDIKFNSSVCSPTIYVGELSVSGI